MITSSSVEIAGISKAFGDHFALACVSLNIRPGEFVTILGPSGCGKSTLLRVIAGLEVPDSGDVRIRGRSMNSIGPRDRGVAFVFQNYALYPHLSCHDNLAAPLLMRELRGWERLPLADRLVPAIGRKRRSINDRVDAVATLLQIKPWLRRKPAQLSGGQRQRVALGRALVREPDVFLLDEPFANLDAALRHQTRAELTALQRRLGTTTIFVTHDQGEAMAMSDRIVVIFEGVVRQIGTPDELYRSPADIDVARFLSQPHLNCLQARVIVDGWVLVGGEHLALLNTTVPGDEGTLAFRPEHCSLQVKRGPGALAGTVERVEHAGADAHFFIRLDAMPASVVVRAGSADLSRWPPGMGCAVALEPHAAWFFKHRSVNPPLRHQAVEAA